MTVKLFSVDCKAYIKSLSFEASEDTHLLTDFSQRLCSEAKLFSVIFQILD